jgi:hypothetical protein
MTDEDAEIKRLFASLAPGPEDDAFAARVERRIRRVQRLRKVAAGGVVLALAASFAVFTPGLLSLGGVIGWAAERASHGATSVLLSPVGALLSIIIGFAYVTARRS